MSNLETIKYEEMQHEAMEEGTQTIEDAMRDHEEWVAKKNEELKPEKFYEVFGRKLTESERDKMTMDVILVEVSNGIREYYKRGGDARILHDQLINTFSYRELSDFVSDADAYLRVPKQ